MSGSRRPAVAAALLPRLCQRLVEVSTEQEDEATQVRGKVLAARFAALVDLQRATLTVGKRKKFDGELQALVSFVAGAIDPQSRCSAGLMLIAVTELMQRLWTSGAWEPSEAFLAAYDTMASWVYEDEERARHLDEVDESARAAGGRALQALYRNGWFTPQTVPV